MMNKLNLKKLLTLMIAPLIMIFALGLISIADVAGKKPTILEFSSPTCSCCVKLKQVLPGVESKYASKIDIQKFNVAAPDSKIKQLMSTYSINTIPTLIFIDKNGNVIRTTRGYLTADQLDTYFNELVSK